MVTILPLRRCTIPCRQAGVRDVQGAHQVQVDDLGPVLGGLLGKGRQPDFAAAPLGNDAGVVDQDVHRIPSGAGLLHRSLHGPPVGHVEGQAERGAAGRRDLVGHLLCPRGQEVVDRDARALGSQRQRDAAAHALAGASHQGHAAPQVQVHRLSLRRAGALSVP
jgi:hypothetical protein